MTDQPVLEKHTIGYVPPEDRHGKVAGPVHALVRDEHRAAARRDRRGRRHGLPPRPLFCVDRAIVVGHLVGGVLMALHSAQGPQMGIPQMIQSRGQFGSYGALIVVVIAAVMYLAFFASNIVLAGQSLHGIAEPVPVSAGNRPRRPRLRADLRDRVPVHPRTEQRRHLGARYQHRGRHRPRSSWPDRPRRSGRRAATPRPASWPRSRSRRSGRSRSRRTSRTTRATSPQTSGCARPSPPPTSAAP